MTLTQLPLYYRCVTLALLSRCTFLTVQMSVFMVFCGPRLPLAFQFVCGPEGGGVTNKLEGKWKVFLCLVAPRQAAAGYSTNRSFCRRAKMFRNTCAFCMEFMENGIAKKNTILLRPADATLPFCARQRGQIWPLRSRCAIPPP